MPFFAKGFERLIDLSVLVKRFVHEEESERLAFFREYGLKYELGKLREDLENFRVPFDVWYSETSLYQNGKIDQALEALREKGHIYEALSSPNAVERNHVAPTSS